MATSNAAPADKAKEGGLQILGMSLFCPMALPHLLSKAPATLVQHGPICVLLRTLAAMWWGGVVEGDPAVPAWKCRCAQLWGSPLFSPCHPAADGGGQLPEISNESTAPPPALSFAWGHSCMLIRLNCARVISLSGPCLLPRVYFWPTLALKPHSRPLSCSRCGLR